MDILESNIKEGYNLDDKNEFKIVRDFIVSNGYNPSNFDNNLKTLVIDNEMNKENKSTSIDYDPFLNKINGTSDGNKFIHELLHMSSYNELNNNDGVKNRFGFGVSLNEGIADYLTKCISDTYNEKYIFEVLFYKSLKYMYPDIEKDGLKKYFEGKSNDYYDLFGEDKKTIIKAVDELDMYNLIQSKRIRSFNYYEEMIDHLVNAFGTLIIHCLKNDKDKALDILDNFEGMVLSRIDEKYYMDVLDKIEEFIEEGWYYDKKRNI